MALKGYCTPLEAMSILGWDYNDANKQLEVATAISFIEEEVEDFCETVFVKQDDAVKVFDGSGTPMLTLGYYLRDLTSVWVLDDNGDRAYELTNAVPMPSASRNNVYRWIELRQTVDFYSREVNKFPAGLANIEVTGDWGLETIPMAVKHAIAMAVKYYFDMRDYDATKEQETGFGRTVIYRGKEYQYLPEISANLLAKWKNSRWMVE